MLDVSWMCRQHMEGLLVTKSDPSIIQSFITVLVLFAMVQTDINPPNTMIPTIEYPDPHIPIITTIKYSILIPSHLMIPTIPIILTIKYSIAICPIWWFWLFNIPIHVFKSFRPASSDHSDYRISNWLSAWPLHTLIEYSVSNPLDPCIFQMNIWSVIRLTLAYTDWIFSQ